MSPGRGKTNCCGELIYIYIQRFGKKHTHIYIYAYNCIYKCINIYIYNIIHTYATMILSGPSFKHWHRKVFPRTFQRATRHANPTYTSQAIDLTQSSSLRKWRGWDGIPESPVSFSLILRECCQLFQYTLIATSIYEYPCNIISISHINKTHKSYYTISYYTIAYYHILFIYYPYNIYIYIVSIYI